MAGRIVYTLSQAAGILGMPEQQISDYITSRQLPAEFNQGIMSYMIQQDALLDFMKTHKMFAQMQKIMVSRVLLCDRDQQMIFLLRTELERGGKITVKVATTAREVEMAITEHLPDVLVMHVAATQRATDNLAGVLQTARQKRPVRVILYHNDPEIVLDGREDIKRIRETLKVDAIVSVAAGTRKLLAAIEETLGVRRETKRPSTIGIGGGTTKFGEPKPASATTPPAPSRPTQPPAAPLMPPAEFLPPEPGSVPPLKKESTAIRQKKTPPK